MAKLGGDFQRRMCSQSCAISSYLPVLIIINEHGRGRVRAVQRAEQPRDAREQKLAVGQKQSVSGVFAEHWPSPFGAVLRGHT